eukprot:5228724-Pleurochrysis_carterae.AAC.1
MTIFTITCGLGGGLKACGSERGAISNMQESRGCVRLLMFRKGRITRGSAFARVNWPARTDSTWALAEMPNKKESRTCNAAQLIDCKANADPFAACLAAPVLLPRPHVSSCVYTRDEETRKGLKGPERA